MTQTTNNPTLEQALKLHQGGKLREAEVLYRKVLETDGRNPDALHLLGALHLQAGKVDTALDLISRAIAIRPGTAEYHGNLGAALMTAGRVDGAIAALRKSIELWPSSPDSHYNLGNALKRRRGKLDEAMTAFKKAIELRPEFAEAYNDLGVVYCRQGKFADGVEAYRNAMSRRTPYPEAQNNIGNALKELGKPEAAMEAYRSAIEMRPKYPDAYNNLGNVLKDLGRLDEAVAGYNQAIAIRADLPAAHWNLALTLLLKGDFEQGWAEHEWRFKVPELSSRPRNFTQPLWDGTALDGGGGGKPRRILLHAEQGLGDTLQFARYVPLVASKCSDIALECQPELVRLLRALPGVNTIIARGQDVGGFDVHCPLLSLPLVIAPTLEDIPREMPYLAADAVLAESWRTRLSALPGLKVGIAWAGNRGQRSDRSRSIPVEALAPLAKVNNVSFVSLQKGEAAAGAAQLIEQGIKLSDWTAELGDFADTAALIDGLDLVIAVDTSVSHLAGGLGKKTWVLLSRVPSWRWMMEREDSPWYPTARLFRQEEIGDWAAPIERLAGELRTMAGG